MKKIVYILKSLVFYVLHLFFFVSLLCEFIIKITVNLIIFSAFNYQNVNNYPTVSSLDDRRDNRKTIILTEVTEQTVITV